MVQIMCLLLVKINEHRTYDICLRIKFIYLRLKYNDFT